MNTQQLQNEFELELVGRGLPLEYAIRTATELADHHRDLVDELRAEGEDETAVIAQATNRLGDSQTLVDKSVRAYRRRHWCGRWPILAFLFAPVAMLVASWSVALLFLFGLHLLREAGVVDSFAPVGTMSTAKLLVASALLIWFVVLTPAFTMFILTRRATRAVVHWSWPLLSTGIVAIVMGTFRCGFSGDGTAFVVGAPLEPFLHPSAVSTLLWYGTNPTQICQFLLPIFVAGAVLWRSRCSVRADQRLVSPAC